MNTILKPGSIRQKELPEEHRCDPGNPETVPVSPVARKMAMNTPGPLTRLDRDPVLSVGERVLVSRERAACP